jgi:6-phosphogluconolactonase (cycloisomerase 2 family)
MAVDKNENFLFVGDATTDDISVFTIAATGALTQVAGSPFALPAGFGTDGIVLNSVGNTLYVAGDTANALAVMSVAANGTLTPIAGSPFPYTVAGTIASFAFASPTLGLGASVGGNLNSYGIGANGAPTLLHSLTLGNNNQSITTARSGQLAVVSGGAVASISVIQVASDGTLTQVAGSPFTTAANTSGYALVNPSGSYLYATEFTGIEAFKMDSAGALTSINTYPIVIPGLTIGVNTHSLVIY